MTLATKILEFGPFWAELWPFSLKMRQFVHLQSNSMILHKFFTKIAISQPRIVQISKFWCLRSSTNIWPANGNINSIPKVKKIELEGKEASKLAKIGQFFALKKLKLHFLKNFPRFDFTAFFCDFQCIRPIIIHWPSSWNRTGVVGGMHGWRV